MTTASDNMPLPTTADVAAGSRADPTEAQAGPASAVVPGSAPLAPDDSAGLLAEHKGKLAIGVAATLGLMVYYGWREKRLAKTDPDEYARLQRIKAVVRETDLTRRRKPVKASAAPGPIALAPQATVPAPTVPAGPADAITAPPGPGSATSGTDAGVI